MQRMRVFLSIVVVFLSLTPGLSRASSPLAGLSAQETPLDPAGAAYEVNPDSQGILWVSDSAAGEIRRVDPSDGGYTIYHVGGLPSDARSDGAGMLWWADTASGKVGRLTTADGKASLWTIPGSSGVYGTALDGSGRLWVTDNSLSFLYRLSLSASEVCTYTLPMIAASDYLVAAGSQVWLEDRVNGQIGRLNVNTSTFTWWSLPSGSRPTGLALDGQGNLWWADPLQGELARLAPGSNRVTRYTQSAVQNPTMLALSDGRVWYTDQTRVGVLDPSLFSGSTLTITPYNQVSPPSCATLAPPSQRTITPATGQAVWASVTYPLLSSRTGWQVFQLPQGATAWGIAALESVWLVDQGRQVLAKLPKETESRVYLPLVLRQRL